jgi:predicted amidohydrolase YtcJ
VILIHVSGHGAVLNSRALTFVGIDANTKTPPGGIINRLPGGKEPAGLLMETAYVPILERLPQPTESERLELMKPAQMMYAREGYTHAQEGATFIRDLDFLSKAAEAGKIFLDIAALPSFVDMPKWLHNPKYKFGQYRKGLKLQGVKFVQDGSPQGKTAYVTTPYLTGGPGGQPNWRGETTQPKDDFLRQVKEAFDAGLQVFIHANGDATIDQAIEAVEKAGISAASDRRTVMVHSQFQRPDQLDKYVKLGISPSYLTNHTFFWGDVHVKNIGPEKAAFISPIKAAKAREIVFSNHTDFNVTPLDPFFVLWTAMARQSRRGAIIGPEQRVDAYTALQGLTTGPAWQLFEENRKGMIKEGLLADFVILSADPLHTDVEKIRDIRVLQTIKEGKTVYTTGE